MAIHIITYTFKKPPLITEERYLNIKLNRVGKNPFPKEKGLFEKFNIIFKIYLIGIPLTLLCLNSGNIWEPFEGIGITFVILLGFGFMSFILTWISYLGYVNDSNKYYKNLMKNLQKSHNYNEFRSLMDLT